MERRKKFNSQDQDQMITFDLRLFMKNLKMKRKEKGISRELLADEIDMHKQYIKLLEDGIRVPDIEIVCRLCEVLGVEISFLIQVLRPTND